MVLPDRAPLGSGGADDDVTHALTEEAPESQKTWTRLLSWDSLRYQGSNWWLDRILPHSPAGLLAAAVLVPCTWFGIGYAITDDRGAYLVAADTRWQLWFLALHIITLRVMASLWARGLEPSLAALGISPERRARVRAGGLGHWANLMALVCGALWIARDTYMAFHGTLDGDDTVWNIHPTFSTYCDPNMWDYCDLGHQIRTMMLIVWHLEWVIFGYLLWLQVWALVAIPRAIKRTDFKPHLARLLIRDQYRDFFTLVSKTATITLVFSLGNLLFLYLSDELFPREVVVIGGFGDVIEQMSDLLSICAMFVLIIAGMFMHLVALRKALTRAVNEKFGEPGDAALELIAVPLQLTGDPMIDAEQLKAFSEAQSTVLRAITFQREIDQIGGRALRTVMAKAAPALSAVVKKVAKMQIGAP